jgi:hypothetical protein
MFSSARSQAHQRHQVAQRRPGRDPRPRPPPGRYPCGRDTGRRAHVVSRHLEHAMDRPDAVAGLCTAQKLKSRVAEADSHLGRVLTAVGRSSVHQETPVRPPHRTGDPIPIIDAPVVRNPVQGLTYPHDRAAERRYEGLGRGWRGVTCSTVSGQSLARQSNHRRRRLTLARSPEHEQPAPPAVRRGDWTPVMDARSVGRCSASTLASARHSGWWTATETAVRDGPRA